MEATSHDGQVHEKSSTGSSLSRRQLPDGCSQGSAVLMLIMVLLVKFGDVKDR